MKKIILTVQLIVLSLLISSCFSNHAHRRGKLSDAMQKASSTNQGSRKVNTTYDPGSSDADQDDDDDNYYELQRLRRENERLRQQERDRELRSNLEQREISSQIIITQPEINSDTTTSHLTLDTAKVPETISIPNYYTAKHRPAPAVKNSGNNNGTFGFRGGSGVLYLDDEYGINYGELMIGNKFKTGSSNFIFGFGYSPLQQIDKTEYHNTTFENSLSGGVFLLGAGWDGHLNPEWKLGFLCPYLILGFKANLMFWDYKNSIEAPVYDDETGQQTGTEMVSKDFIFGIEAYTGIGINLIHTNQIELGLEFMPGGIVWLPGTYQGFDNDVFDAFKYTKIGLQLKFSK